MQDGRRRHALDALLREAAAQGMQVGAHPDVIDRLGVKSVLVTTRALGWSGDAWACPSEAALRKDLPRRLASEPRVLKPNRGNGGGGVWRIERIGGGEVEVMAAACGAPPQAMDLDAFLAARCAEIADADGFVDRGRRGSAKG
ncbi:hypothetical protein [Phenylobacterium sp. J367]|uniref:hypothetical protein n=1 Tax=Phenylobacterium sp. J367 TaxID=2898435 RepID=UPI0021509CAC|nr:hypothetical protein [Phenylobacterium sp. J367]MCR5877307.1 hypothetical protein [Phenylobacterium sp. J367]